MVSILMILMTSLVALTMQTLYRATLDMTRASLIVISDSALTEVLILLSDDPLWGKNNEKLFMKTGNPDMKIAGFNPFALPAANSRFDFEDNTAYYISFDPNDSAFGTNRCFSVNNLDGDTPVPGWRPGIDVPAHTADIVVTVMEDGVVRHAEAFVMKNLAGNFQNGSRGSAIITANSFTLDSKYEPTSFHSNYDDTSALDEVSMAFYDVAKTGMNPTRMGWMPLEPVLSVNILNGTVSACSDIEILGLAPDPNLAINMNEDPKDIPAISISTIISDITFEPTTLPSGTYETKRDSLESDRYLVYTSDISGETKTFYYGDEIIPGVIFTEDRGILISENIQVAYDPNQEIGTGNITLKAYICVEKGIHFYVPGSGIMNPDGKYNSGNAFVSMLLGEGNFYTMGTFTLDGSGETGSKDIDIENSVALYSEGDITFLTGLITLNGLVYTRGDFTYKNKSLDVNTTTEGNNLTINGALIVAGKDSKEDPDGFDPGNIDITANRVNITFDDTVLETINKYSGSGGGSVSLYRLVCWYEF